MGQANGKKEQELMTNIKKLQADLKASKNELAETKAKREQLEGQLQEKEIRAIELKTRAKARAAVAPQQQRLQRGNSCCTEGLAKERIMKAQLEDLQNKVHASAQEIEEAKSALQNMESSVAAEMKKSKSAQASLNRARDNALNKANNKVMYGSLYGAGFPQTLEELVKQLDLTQAEINHEKQLAELSQTEAEEFDKIAKALEKKLGDAAKKNNLPFFPSKNFLRAKTPAQQRAIKEKLQETLQELEAAELEKAAHEVRHDSNSNKLEKIRSRTATLEELLQAKAKTSSFAYKQQPAAAEGGLQVAEAN